MSHEELLNDILPSTTHYDLNLIEEGKFDVSDLFTTNQIQQDSKTVEFLKTIKTFYNDGLFCDLRLVAGNVDYGFNSIPCHSLVLVSTIPGLKQLCESALNSLPEDDFARLYFTEFSFDEMKSFIDNIYLAMTNNADIAVSLSLVKSFGLKPEIGSNIINFPSLVDDDVQISRDENKAKINQVVPMITPEATTRKSSRKRKKIVDDLSDYGEDNLLEAESGSISESDEKPKRRARNTKAVSQNNETNHPSINNDFHVVSHLQLEQVVNDQLQNLSQLLPYNWSLTEPSLFSSAEDYQKLLETSRHPGTVIHALTGPHFDFTQEVASPWEERYSNKVRKLIRMPERTISVICAVGMRNNTNIIQPVAIKSWPVKLNFDNLIEMLLNLCGTSKTKFFSHDRYYKFKKIASKPNRVGRALQSIKKLSEEDREMLRMETIKAMNDLEAVRNRLHFAHLPVISVKMQFSHVSDMATQEILDYAVLYGNDVSDLSIKSFSNLQIRDFDQNDWISIFLDLMVDFLSVENPLALRTNSSTKELFEPIDQLVFRHQAFDLVSNPTKKYCIPCRTVFPYSTPQEIQDFETHSQEHSIKKEESAGLLSCTGSAKCSKLFQTQEALAEHVAKCHDKSVKGDGSYCDTCGKFLPNVHRLKKHHDAHHRQIKCKVCGAFFPGTIGLASHRDRVHSQQLPCPHCHKLLPSRVKLEYHMISHMAPEEKKYICEKCGKRFGWSHHLAKHEMNVHVRSRPYKCSVEGCNWAFNDLSNRNMHERRVHKLGPPPKR